MSEKDNQESEPLSPEQRIELLEAKVGKNRVGLLFVALILTVALSASITAFMIYYFGGASSGDSPSSEISQQLEAHKELIEQYDVNMAQLRQEIKSLESQLGNTSNRTLQRVLIEQEQAKQRFMETVRSAIYDLAHMVPGSRSWLELYTEQLDDATVKSQSREKQLEKLETSEPVSENDPFF